MTWLQLYKHIFQITPSNELITNDSNGTGVGGTSSAKTSGRKYRPSISGSLQQGHLYIGIFFSSRSNSSGIEGAGVSVPVLNNFKRKLSGTGCGSCQIAAAGKSSFIYLSGDKRIPAVCWQDFPSASLSLFMASICIYQCSFQTRNLTVWRRKQLDSVSFYLLSLDGWENKVGLNTLHGVVLHRY